MFKLLFIGLALILYLDPAYTKVETDSPKVRQKRFVPLAAANGALNGVAALITIGQYIDTFFDSNVFKYQSWQDVDKSLKEFEKFSTYSYNTTINSLKELPNVLSYLSEERNFRNHLFRIHEIYRLVLRTRKLFEAQFLKGESMKVTYQYIEDFVREKDASIEESILEIRRIIVDTDTTGFISEDYITLRKKYVGVCSSQKSELQLLDALLIPILDAYSEYYHAKLSLLLLFQINHPKSVNIAMYQRILKTNINFEYKMIFNALRKQMGSASKEFWKCDARHYRDDDPNKSSSEYHRIRQMSKYLFKTSDRPGTTCGENKYPDACDVKYNGTRPSKDSFCHAQRKCNNGFLHCEKLRPSNPSSKSALVCSNGNKLNPDLPRYHKVDLAYTEGTDSACSQGIKKEIKYDIDESGYCECLCLENKYFFVNSWVFSNFHSNKVITGVRFRVSYKNWIKIEIQEARVSANQSLNTKPTWQIVEPRYTTALHESRNMHTLESLELSEIKNIKHTEAIVGVELKYNKDTGRVKLVAYTMPYDYATGIITDDWKIKKKYSPEDVTTEYKLENRGVSTRGPELNYPVSASNNRYISFTTTSMLEDGGQTTIPFIDTQDVVPAGPVLPLSGVGLYLRGQDKYGGFLALKTFTYDLKSWIDENYDDIINSKYYA